MNRKKSPAFQSLLEIAEITGGRIWGPDVFKDFVYILASVISHDDQGHWLDRLEETERIQARYREDEQIQLFLKMKEFSDLIDKYLKQEVFIDILGQLYFELCKPEKGQFFSPPSIGQIMAEICFAKQIQIPKKGYFTLFDPVCGSGSLLLKMAECLQHTEIDYRSEFVFCAQDIDPLCACMTFIQASLYSMTGVIVNGNTITGRERTRWYTPNYARRDWIFREPFHLDGLSMNFHNELFMIGSYPMHRAFSWVKYASQPKWLQDAIEEQTKRDLA